MDRGKNSGELLARTLDLCQHIRELTAEEIRFASEGESREEEHRGGAERTEGELDSAVKEFTSLIDEIRISPLTGADRDCLKTEIGVTVESIEEAARTVREAKDAIRSKHNDARNRNEAIRAYLR